MASATPMLDDIQIVDADAHISEPYDLWSSRAPAAWRDRLPHIQEIEGQKHWVVDRDVVLGPAGADRGDQLRVAGVTETIAAGADFLVVGRPIRDAREPERSAEAICEEIRAALGLRANSGEEGG